MAEREQTLLPITRNKDQRRPDTPRNEVRLKTDKQCNGGLSTVGHQRNRCQGNIGDGSTIYREKSPTPGNNKDQNQENEVQGNKNNCPDEEKIGNPQYVRVELRQGAVEEAELLGYEVLTEVDLQNAYPVDESNGNESSSCSSTTPSRDSSSVLNQSTSRSLDGSSDVAVNYKPKTSPSESANLPSETDFTRLDSVYGRKMFIRAIPGKHMNIYFAISQQRLCGEFTGNQSMATFLLALNSLEMGNIELQGKYFKSHNIDRQMSFRDMACVTRENNLSAEVSQVYKNSCHANFRKAVKLSCKSSNIVLLCAYRGENSMEQFSVIGGYFKDRDEILLFTPTKSKLHAHWVPMLRIWRILLNEESPIQTRKGIHLKDGYPGGYMLLQKKEDQARIAVRIHKNALLCLDSSTTIKASRRLESLLCSWNVWLDLPVQGGEEEQIVTQALNCVLDSLASQASAARQDSGSVRMLKCRVGSLSDVISRTDVYKAVKLHFNSLGKGTLEMIEGFSQWVLSIMYSPSYSNGYSDSRKLTFRQTRKKKKGHSKEGAVREIYYDNVMMSLCLLFWPYQTDRANTNGALLFHSVHSDVVTFPLDQVVRVREQVKFVVQIMQYSINSRH